MARDGGGGRGGEDDEDGSRACVRAARARAAATSCAHCRAARAVTYRYADGVKACAACDGARADGARVSRRAHRLCEECVGGDPALAEWFCAQDEVREGWTSATRWVDNEVMDKARAR